MGFLSRKLRNIQGGVSYYCPGCKCRHAVYTEPGSNRFVWTWNKDTEAPTFSPSLWIKSDVPVNEADIEKLKEDIRRKQESGIPIPYHEVSICHSIIVNGNITFLNDCRHDLAGKTVPMPDLPEVINGVNY